MIKIFCLIGIDDNYYEVSDLSSIFRNTPVPGISSNLIDKYEYPIENEIEIGQLFYYSKEVSPGKMKISVEPIKLSEYKSMIRGFELFIKSGNSAKYSNSLKNKTFNLLCLYHDNNVIKELRDQKINNILDEGSC